MGCFFGCIRIRDDHRSHRHLVSKPVPSNTKGLVAPRNRNCLSSLLLSEGSENYGSGRKSGINIKELKDEAKYLKACGTIPETPAEIRKASETFDDLSHSEPSKFHSWLPNTSTPKLNLDKLPVPPIKLSEEWDEVSDFSVQSPSSCITYGQDNGKISFSSSSKGNKFEDATTSVKVSADHAIFKPTSALPGPLAPRDQFKNKSINFDIGGDGTSALPGSSSSGIASQNSKLSDSEGNCSVSKPSPYPTPLKLTDDMQTPGTIFPAYLQNMKNPRIRSQYVYSVLNPVENYTQWKMLREEQVSESTELQGLLSGSFEKDDNNTLPNSEVGTKKEAVAEKDLKVDASLSSWMETNQDGNNRHFVSISSNYAQLNTTPGDRPIIGMVAAHWSEDELTRISPKWWDGNGIPNSTNKYKEDQKVSWHATPFEERLEKALSEENLISQRKHIYGTIQTEPDENEECDTAISKLESSSGFKSVVSF